MLTCKKLLTYREKISTVGMFTPVFIHRRERVHPGADNRLVAIQLAVWLLLEWHSRYIPHPCVPWLIHVCATLICSGGWHSRSIKHAYTLSRTHVHTHICAHTNAHTCTHTRTHTHEHNRTHWGVEKGVWVRRAVDFTHRWQKYSFHLQFSCLTCALSVFCLCFHFVYLPNARARLLFFPISLSCFHPQSLSRFLPHSLSRSVFSLSALVATNMLDDEKIQVRTANFSGEKLLPVQLCSHQLAVEWIQSPRIRILVEKRFHGLFSKKKRSKSGGVPSFPRREHVLQ